VLVSVCMRACVCVCVFVCVFVCLFYLRVVIVCKSHGLFEVVLRYFFEVDRKRLVLFEEVFENNYQRLHVLAIYSGHTSASDYLRAQACLSFYTRTHLHTRK
jgi:hypothetical protein